MYINDNYNFIVAINRHIDYTVSLPNCSIFLADMIKRPLKFSSRKFEPSEITLLSSFALCSVSRLMSTVSDEVERLNFQSDGS